MAEFEFKKIDYISDGEIDLIIEEKRGADSEKKRVPEYFYAITLHHSAERIGAVNLIIGENKDTFFRGHIGYKIDEKHRGNSYAAKACRLIKEVALAHDIERLYITCNPDNYPSRRTCEKIGAKLVEVVDIPRENEMYRENEKQKCRYEWFIK
ncbi:MAG: GNAT family N-acetyltransferase [Clostridia bacterium]